MVGTECLGGVTTIVPVGQVAAADIERYLKNLRPPDLTIVVSPPTGAVVHLPTYFMAQPPSTLRPVPFGGGQVAETITIAPEQYSWSWGDGSVSGWTDDAGGPYPDGTLTHVYDGAGHLHGNLTTRWGGGYTVTVAGQTFGPYTAIGTVSRTQPFTIVVLEAHGALVSHG
jgi:hypothetical protein